MPDDCDRSSGRSRIGTGKTLSASLSPGHCDRSSGRSRIGTEYGKPGPRAGEDNCDRSSGRSRIGTGSIGTYHLCLRDCDRSSGRSRIGTKPPPKPKPPKKPLRSFFGAIEDWNLFVAIQQRFSIAIAIVLRGDRGLEQVK